MFDHVNHWLRTLPEKLRQLLPLQRFALLGIPAAVLAVLVVMVTLWGVGEKEQQQVLYMVRKSSSRCSIVSSTCRMLGLLRQNSKR